MPEQDRPGAEPIDIDVVLNEFSTASFDAVRLFGAVIRGQSTNPFDPTSDPIAVLGIENRLDLAKHLIEHAGPLVEQLNALRRKPGGARAV